MRWIYAAFVSFILIGISSGVSAHHLLDTPPLKCDEQFPCPPELTKRIQFWVAVYSQFGEGTVVFHDSRQPERVYSILETKESCQQRREAPVIIKERSRVREELLSVATKIESGNTEWTEAEKHFVELFPLKNVEDIREAAENIRCQEGNKDRFMEGLRRFGHYQGMVVAQLKAAGLPEDLKYLPMVESSYNPSAYSRVGAAGLWQIMPRTARVLKLSVNAAVDERFDPEAATRGAVKYISGSYQGLQVYAASLTGSVHPGVLGPFVITSYNYGTAGVQRAMNEMGPDFVKVLFNYSGKRFRTAVQNFYTSFLAARHVAQAKISEIVVLPLKPSDKIIMKRAVYAQTLAAHVSVPTDVLKEHNPALTRRVWNGRLPIPKDYVLGLPTKSEGWASTLATLWEKPAEEPQVQEESYRVVRGDSACNIAKTFGVSCVALIDANDLDRRGTIRINQILTIPAAHPQQAPKSKLAAAASEVKHAVRTGLESVKILSPKPKPAFVPEMRATDIQSSAPAEETAGGFGVDEDLFVSLREVAGEKQSVVRMETEETLDHYADWLGLPGPEPIRDLNHFTKEQTALPVGSELILPVKNEKIKKEFERRRIAYHRTLEEEYKQRFDIIGQDIYIVKANENEWSISNQLQVPVWLIKRFNPEVLGKPLKAGTELKVPVIAERKD